MRRTREFWARLEPDERSLLVLMDRSRPYGSMGGGGYLPDDCSECTFCGQPMFGGGRWCSYCGNRYDAIVRKGEGQ